MSSTAAEHWLLDSLADGVILIDDRWRVMFVNHAAEALLAIPRERVLHQPATQELLRIPGAWLEVLREAMRERGTRRLEEIRVDFAGGTKFFAGEVQPSPTGGVALLFRDVTEKKHDEEVLRLRDRAMTASPNGIILTDAMVPSNPIIYVNPAFCKLTGYSFEEVRGKNCRFLQRDDRDQPALDEIRRAVASGESCTTVLRNYRKDGTLFWNQLSIAPVRDETGLLTHFVGIQQDITDRTRVQEALVERNAELKTARDQLEVRNLELRTATQAKDRFMATMSHEMRTPLNAILGYVELLNMGIAGEMTEAQKAQLERIEISGRSLLELINDVLDFTRAEAGRLVIELRPLHLPAVTEEAVELLRVHASSKGIPIRVEPYPETLPAVTGDFRRLRQVLANLLSNAVKFTHEGSITVHFARPDDDHIAVSVQDTGIGIPEDELSNIFTEFYQADADLTREYGGTGLGLAISQRLAHLMGGEITVESQRDQGSTFTLVLPIAGEEALATERQIRELRAKHARPEREKGDESATVVIFGKDELVLDELRERLHPYVRVIATGVADGVAELARVEKASLVVLDVACDGGAGWEAAHTVRENPELDDVAVLLLPCLPQSVDGSTAGALDLGWVAVVPKPFTSTQLTQVVTRAAARDGDGTPGQRPPIDVLVVDDDPDTREIAAKILRAGGAEVRTAHDGEAGLAQMRESIPDVAVLDLMMPVLDGFGVLAAMRADPSLQEIPVVVLTAKDLSEAERRFLARTAETVLHKGVHTLSDVATLVLRAAQQGEA